MSKYLLFVALAGHGHVTPTLPLVEALVRRGNRVDYATSVEHSDAVTTAGARWVRLPPLEPFHPSSVEEASVAGWFRHLFAGMRVTYPILHEHAVAERPDGVCYDATNWPARLLAQTLDIPAVRCVPHLASNEVYSLDQRLTAGLDAEDPLMAQLAGDCARFSTEHGVDLDVAGTMDVPEALNLVFVPRQFQPAGDSFDERFCFVGPMLGMREQVESWSPPDSEVPVLYISLGTIFTDRPDFYRTCLDAFGDGSRHVAMTIGDVSVDTLGTIPATVDIRARFPQLAVLRHATAFLSHAGMNSVMEALHYGVPLVTLPQMPEQFTNADRLHEIGIGKRLDADTLTPEMLRTAIARVESDSGTQERVAWMQRAIQESGGTARAADLIENHLD